MDPIPDSSVQQNVRQGWDGTMEGIISGFPQADNSFGWFQPFDPHANLTQQQHLSNSSNTTSAGPHLSSSGASRLQPNHEQPAFIPSNYATSHQYNDYGSYAGSVQSALIDPAVGLGSMTESEIDSGWLSFMQDCGITMHSPPR